MNPRQTREQPQVDRLPSYPYGDSNRQDRQQLPSSELPRYDDCIVAAPEPWSRPPPSYETCVGSYSFADQPPWPLDLSSSSGSSQPPVLMQTPVVVVDYGLLTQPGAEPWVHPRAEPGVASRRARRAGARAPPRVVLPPDNELDCFPTALACSVCLLCGGLPGCIALMLAGIPSPTFGITYLFVSHFFLFLKKLF